MRQQRRLASDRVTLWRGLCAHRSVSAWLAVLFYAAAVLVLPGLHLWRHADDHHHLAGGIHYRLYASPARHAEHDADAHRHDENATSTDAAEVSDGYSTRADASAELRPIDSQPSPAPFISHAADRSAHFASSYLALSQGLVAPLALPACTPAIRTIHQAPHARSVFWRPLGARAAHYMASVLAFGAAALMFLVTEELLTEAHEEKESPALTAMFFGAS